MKTQEDTTSDNLDKKKSRVVQKWLNEIKAAKKREKDFHKDGQRILEIYSGKRKDEIPYNILFSNTETLLPALYSAIPRPVVTRRFKDEDPLGKAAATAGQRILEFLVDTNIDGYETYDEAVRSTTLDGLLPGRGVTSVKYDAEVKSEEKEDKKEEPDLYKKSELVCLNARLWNRCYFGYAKKWSKVPWVAYEEHIDKEEAKRLFGKEVASKLKYTDREDQSEDDEYKNEDEKNRGEIKTACVYQIWDKAGGRKVRYVSAQYQDGYLLEQDDPLELTGFFDCPRPLKFVEKSNELTPVAMYALYENQAAELNRITVRINRIVEAIKARGVYDSELGEEIANIMSVDDNTLVPADKSSSLAAEKGLDKAIWFMPVEQLINVLIQLYSAREQCKRVIYEITGISDIIRGSTVASETATAQQIKSQWGTLRLKRPQKELQRYTRDLLRMMLEVAATKFSEETWAKMTGLPFLLDAKFNELTMIAQALQSQVQMESMRAQQMGQPQQPGQAQQQLQEVMQQLQAPKWSDVLSMLRDDMQRAYRIDIETNSTIEPEAAEDQKSISDLLNAMGQYLNGVGPLVAKGVLPFGVAQSMLLAITRRFRFGTEVEDYIKQMKEPAPEGDGGEQKVQAAQQQAQKSVQDASTKAAQAEMQMKQMQSEKMIFEKQTALDIREIKLESEEAIFKLQKEAAAQSLNAKSELDKTKLHHEQKFSQLQNGAFKTENVVNKKVDEHIGKGINTTHQMIKQLSDAQINLLKEVSNQSTQLQSIMKAVFSKRERTPVRGSDGRIVKVIEEVIQ